jgi:hypothetical protein
MDDKTYAGALGEAKVIAALTADKYHVFGQITGKAPFDLVAYKDGKLYKISIKTITGKNRNGTYTVQLKAVRSNRNKNRIINFDNSLCDIVAVYILPEDKIVMLNSNTIIVKSSLTVKIS